MLIDIYNVSATSHYVVWNQLFEKPLQMESILNITETFRWTTGLIWKMFSFDFFTVLSYHLTPSLSSESSAGLLTYFKKNIKNQSHFGCFRCVCGVGVGFALGDVR